MIGLEKDVVFSVCMGTQTHVCRFVLLMTLMTRISKLKTFNIIPIRDVFSDASRQRTKTISGTLEPQWRETFVYESFEANDFHVRALEITVFDYDRVHSAQYVGEVRCQGSKSIFDYVTKT